MCVLSMKLFSYFLKSQLDHDKVNLVVCSAGHQEEVSFCVHWISIPINIVSIPRRGCWEQYRMNGL